jgi:hypothetical protein
MTTTTQNTDPKGFVEHSARPVRKVRHVSMGEIGRGIFQQADGLNLLQ